MNIYLLLFLEFFKIGLFTFGGGYAMIPLVKETVLNYSWLTESEFYNFIGICESTPGPIAINMATYIGAKQGDFTIIYHHYFNCCNFKEFYQK